ncbi:hypothetical protein TNCV_3363221 [Trichonephila clavipes]|nr:hypothetical protein TNCV_3363221 [Trichonephila clavipes]
MGKNDRKAGGGASYDQCSSKVWNQQKVISITWNIFQTIGTTVKKIGEDFSWRRTLVDDRYIVLQVKRTLYQSASTMLSKFVQQHNPN